MIAQRTASSSIRNTPRSLWIILAVALILRIGAALYLGNEVSGLSGAHDEISYSMLGQRFADGYGMTFPENWYPWIKADATQSYYSFSYSAILAGIYSLFGYQPLIARLIHAVMGVGVVYMIFLTGRNFFSEKVGLLAAAIAAVYAYLIFYSVTLVTETPFILALLIAIYVAGRVREDQRSTLWLLLGFVLSITVLLRMAVIFFIPFLLLWVLLQLPKQQWWRVVIPIAMMVAALTPFVLRNQRLWGHFMLLESQFGHVFWNGNHPNHEGDFHPYVVFEIPEEVLQLNNDAAMTSALLELGIENVKADPFHFIQLTGTRLRELFTFWPTADSSLLANLMRVASFGVLIPFLVLGLVLAMRDWQRYLLIFLFIGLHTGIYAVTWTMIRYRIPLDAFFVMFAASGLVWLFEWAKKRELLPRHSDISPA